MSNFLAIDTSSRYLAVLAVKGAKVAARYLPDCALKHSVVLMGEIDKVLKEASLSPAECDFFAAVTGPGSFTGIRIGISTAKGFAVGVGKPLVSVTAFELLAYNVEDDDFYTVIDAAHSHYYVCGFNNKKEVIFKPRYMSAEEVENLNANLYGFEDLPLSGYTKLDIQNCLYCAVKAKSAEKSDKMQALYVRKSQAEENRKC
ncbi:MAG: tRNA (adenosine(37)-N6)-threonylcarbamoyltransferase complex dimerization subunit type 1 TsaB [Clostridia bacterium]|nr:tRNA (adenosine(37)-N6)-threonylcarbamoyltransferase complex dimerization subunit type 1 TsaB [Clostridia bacterium]